MAINFRLTGSGTGPVKAIQDIDKAAERAEDSFEDLAKSATKAEKAAKRIREAVDPLERYKRKVQEVWALNRQGLLTDQQRIAALGRLRQQLDRAGEAGKRAFGRQALTQLTQYAAGFLSIQTAISSATQALRQLESERQAAAEEAAQGRRGLSSLAQLAINADDPQARFAELVAEARAARARGAFQSEEQAGGTLFSLVSAGLEKADRDFAFRLRETDVFDNIGELASAYDALKTSVGEVEVGSFQDFVSAALAASSAAPALAQQIPIAAAEAGGGARRLGLSDEFILAATAVTAKATGSAGRGGTQVANLIKQLEIAAAERPELIGIGDRGLIEFLQGLTPEERGFGGILGKRAEAVGGLRNILNNLELFQTTLSTTQGAAARRLAAGATELPATDPVIGAAQRRERAAAQLQATRRETSSEAELLLQTVRDEIREAQIAQGAEFTALLENIAFGIRDLFQEERIALRNLLENQSGLSEETRADIEGYLERTADATEATAAAAAGGVEGRQE